MQKLIVLMDKIKQKNASMNICSTNFGHVFRTNVQINTTNSDQCYLFTDKLLLCGINDDWKEKIKKFKKQLTSNEIHGLKTDPEIKEYFTQCYSLKQICLKLLLILHKKMCLS